MRLRLKVSVLRLVGDGVYCFVSVIGEGLEGGGELGGDDRAVEVVDSASDIPPRESRE